MFIALGCYKTLDSHAIIEATNEWPGGATNAPSRGKPVVEVRMSSITAPRFYVYILVRSTTGKPFYVGKGQGDRVYGHEEEARRKCSCHKCNVIRKIWRNGGQVQRYIIFTTNDEQEALAYEVETIALYGRKTLTNLTDGGEGTSNPSEETLAKRSAALRGHITSAETRAKISATSKARRPTPETRAKISAGNQRRYATAEARARHGDVLRGRVFSAEARANIGAAVRRRFEDPAVQAKHLAAQQAVWSDPERREKQRAVATAIWSDPVRRAQQSERSKAMWARRKAKQNEKDHE